MPSLPSVKEVAQGRAALDSLAAAAGRDSGSIEVMAFGRPGQFRDRETIKDLERAGASRVTVWLDQTSGREALAEMERIAQSVLY